MSSTSSEDEIEEEFSLELKNDEESIGNLPNTFKSLWESRLTSGNVTLCIGNELILAHKLVLASSSIYFKEILEWNPSENPFIVLDKDLNLDWLMKCIEFMYLGQIDIQEEKVDDFLKVAKYLKIDGLSNNTYNADTD